MAAVTGAASGIGAAACAALARRGDTVYALDVQAERLQEVVDGINDSGLTAVAVSCDIASAHSVAAAFNRIGSESGRIDSLFCSAAVFPRVPFQDIDAAAVSLVMDVNFRGAVLCVCEAMRHMTGGGRIVVMTSGSGSLDAARHPFQRGFSLYGASKAALDRWALGVADELSEQGVTINILGPGAIVRSSGVEALHFPEKTMRGALSADDIAPAVVALLSAGAGSATAHRLLATEFGTTWGVGPGWFELRPAEE